MSWFDINPKNFSPLKFSEKIFPAAEYFKQNLMPFARSQAYFAGEEI